MFKRSTMRQAPESLLKVCIFLLITSIQNCLAGNALITHWNREYSRWPALLEVSAKIKQQWLDRDDYRGWYHRFVHTISTNNGLERRNRTIKDIYTWRERLPLAEFIAKNEEMLHDWSSELTDE